MGFFNGGTAVGKGTFQQVKVNGPPVPPTLVVIVVSSVAAGSEKKAVNLLAGETRTAHLGDCIGVRVLWNPFDVGYMGVYLDAILVVMRRSVCIVEVAVKARTNWGPDHQSCARSYPSLE